MPTQRELDEFVYDERISFRLPKRHKRLLDSAAKSNYDSVGDILRAMVRKWVKEKEAPRTE